MVKEIALSRKRRVMLLLRRFAGGEALEQVLRLIPGGWGWGQGMISFWEK